MNGHDGRQGVEQTNRAASGELEGRFWKVGTGKVDITPLEPIRLSGYSGRLTPSEGVLANIHGRALAIEDAGDAISVILSTDLLGFSQAMVDALNQRVLERFGVERERLILNASHNHSAPVTGDLLHLYYEFGPEESRVNQEYTAWLIDRLVEVVGIAVDGTVEAQLSFGQSLAGFGVNRRRSRAGCRHLPGPVDQDVPVLCARGADGGLQAIVFGYACHTTTSCGQQIHGDYSGFAASHIERLHPGVTALFLAGCGGDINPLPRYREGLPETYGMILATAVEDVLAAPMEPVHGPLRVALREVDLALQAAPGAGDFESMLEGASGKPRREIEFQLAKLRRDGQLPRSCKFTLQVWKFGGGLTWIGLAGEPVVDYSLLFKARYGWDSTWVSGYCNELLAYIPSLRVLREGGYEGSDAMLEYGLPAPFDESVETTIGEGVDELLRELTIGTDSATSPKPSTQPF